VAIGANDNTMANAVGAKTLSLRVAVFLGAILLVLGSVLLGQNVSVTFGTRLVFTPFAPSLVVIATLAMILVLLISSYFGYPVSATHALFGSILGIALWLEWTTSTAVLQWSTVFELVVLWLTTPLLALALAYGLQRAIRRYVLTRLKGLDAVERVERRFGQLMLLVVVVVATSRGGNDVAKAVGPLTMVFTTPAEMLLPLLVGGIGMAVGLVAVGRRVIRRIGMELTEMRPSSSFSGATAAAIIIVASTLLGLPVAATHILIMGILGAARAGNTPVEKGILRRISFASVLAVPVSVVFAWGLLWLFQFLGELGIMLGIV
jgi:PiT family inorganic phosphate transporter